MIVVAGAVAAVTLGMAFYTGAWPFNPYRASDYFSDPLVARLAAPGALRSELIERGRARVGRFSFESFRSRVRELLSLRDGQLEAHGAW